MDINIEELLEAPFKKEEPLSSRYERPSSSGGGGSGGNNRSSDERPSSLDYDNSQSRHHSSRDEEDRDGSRSKRRRSRSRDRHNRSRSPTSRRSERSDRDRDRDRDRDYHRSSRRDRSRDRDRDRRRSSRERSHRESSSYRREEILDTEPVVHLTDAERDRRTVFIMQLAARVRQSDIFDFFEKAGRVRDVRLVTDRITRKSKGVGYVEFYDEEAVPLAIAMTGQKLLGIPIIVHPSEAEKNRLAAEAEVAAAAAALDKSGAPGSIFTRLYVGSLHYTLTDAELHELFSPFGPLDFINLHKDETGRSKGFAFVQYKYAEHAKEALEKLQGFELKGRQIKIGLSADKASSFHIQSGMASMDDDDKIGIALSSAARVNLMAKLAREEDGLLNTIKPPKAPTVNPSRCVLLENMFDPTTETEPEWEKEIEEDVKGECSKFGKVLHVAVNKESEGHVYLKFDSIPFAQSAINALNGRFFAGKQIRATFVQDSAYNSRFPSAAYL